MYLSKFQYLPNSGNLFIRNRCEECGEMPAVAMNADCNGDGIQLCVQHWQEKFDEILKMFDMDEGMVVANIDRHGVYRYKQQGKING